MVAWRTFPQVALGVVLIVIPVHLTALLVFGEWSPDATALLSRSPFSALALAIATILAGSGTAFVLRLTAPLRPIWLALVYLIAVPVALLGPLVALRGAADYGLFGMSLSLLSSSYVIGFIFSNSPRAGALDG